MGEVTKVRFIFSLFAFYIFASSCLALADSPRIVNPDNNHEYQRIDATTTWGDAKGHCEGLGGYLATILTAAENAFVWENLIVPVNEGCWLGGTDEIEEGVWRWMSGEPWNYTNWDDGEPNNLCEGAEDYLHMHPYGAWNDQQDDGWCLAGTGIDCLICEWNASYPASANAEASTYGANSLPASGSFNALALLFVPVGAIVGLLIWRRNR